MFMKTYKLLIISIFMLIISLSYTNTYAEYYDTCFEDNGCDYIDTYTTFFNVHNQNGGGFCSGKVEFKLYKCDGPPVVYKLLITDISMLGCENTPAPDADDIVNEAQKKALEMAGEILKHIPPTIKTIEITIPSCLNIDSSNPPYTAMCGECCTSVYTFGNNFVYQPTTYSTETCNQTTSCEPVCQYARIPLGELNQYYYPNCGDNANYQLIGYVMGSLTTNINLDFYANTRSGIDAGGNYHLTVFNISTVSGSSNTIQDANGFREAMEYVLKNITNYMPSSYNYENIFLHINSCWQRVNWQIVPCSDQCCTLEFEVTSVSPLRYNCLTTFTPVTCDSPCFEVCEEVSQIVNPTPKKIFKSDYEDKINESIEIIPNPSKGETKILYKSELSGELKIIISDLKGNEILNEISTKGNQEYQFNFNTSKNTNGMYIINIYINGVGVTNAKFIINN